MRSIVITSIRLGALATLLGVVLAASTVYGEPASAEATTTRDEGAAQLRTRLESSMARLGELANDARRESDLVRAACVLDKHARATQVMELATAELMVVRDRSAGQDARSFALEKLRAAVDRVDSLAGAAATCVGEGGPESDDDQVATDAVTPRSIPVGDATQGMGDSPLPPSADAGWVAVASPME
ncbi:MAG: hypothetical protein V3V08_19565 [Nannocystaceae bacterium]